MTPAVVRKNPRGGWDIVDKDTGAKKGHSGTKAEAQASANARNASRYGWKPTGKKAKKK